MRCVECGRGRTEKEFWPNRKVCKWCLASKLDINNPQSMFESLDIPYIKYYWSRFKPENDDLRSRKNALGKYIYTMRMYSFKNYRYEDSQRLNSVFKEKDK